MESGGCEYEWTLSYCSSTLLGSPKTHMIGGDSLPITHSEWKKTDKASCHSIGSCWYFIIKICANSNERGTIWRRPRSFYRKHLISNALLLKLRDSQIAFLTWTFEPVAVRPCTSGNLLADGFLNQGINQAKYFPKRFEKGGLQLLQFRTEITSMSWELFASLPTFQYWRIRYEQWEPSSPTLTNFDW